MRASNTGRFRKLKAALFRHRRLHERCPTGYRRVWFDYERNYDVCAPLGLHWPARILYVLWTWTFRIRRTAFERRLADARHAGFREGHQKRRNEAPARIIVCLCGSTRFWREFQRAQIRETLAGKIVLSLACATGTDDEHFKHLSPEQWCRVKAGLDELHLRKIELADEVVILNVDGYIGESTAAELAHAQKLGKTVCFLEPRLAGREAPA